MEKIRVTPVKYINSYPFMIGLKEEYISSLIETDVRHPSECADRLISGQTDIGLIPVAMLAAMKEYHIVSDYCLSADGEVRTVLLVSNDPLDNVKKIYTDFRSRSSVALCKILAAKYWKKDFEWQGTTEDFDITAMKQGEAAVMIGDRCFEYARHFSHRLDLGLEWKNFTGLPFVFACWVTNKELPADFLTVFNRALEEGVRRRNEAVYMLGDESAATPEEVIEYLNLYIDFNLDDNKKKAIGLFIEYIRDLKIY